MLKMILFLSLAVIPLYTFDSGGIQLSHVVTTIFASVVIMTRRIQLRADEAVWFMMAAYVALRVFLGSVFGESLDTKAIVEVFYILFPLATLISYSRIAADPVYQLIFVKSLFAAVVVALVGVAVYGSSITLDEGAYRRAVGTFNNPNQLAYFSVCVLALANLFYLREWIGRRATVALISGSMMLAITSLSKAGMIAVGMTALMAIGTLNQTRRIRTQSIVVVLVFSVIFISAYTYGIFDDFSFTRRLEAVGQDSDDSLASRGYRIKTSPI